MPGHNSVEGVKCSGVPVRAVGGQMQDEGHRGGAEIEAGVGTVDQRCDAGQGVVHSLPVAGAAAGPLDVEQSHAEVTVSEGLAAGQ